MKNNIFESVVKEVPVTADPKTVLVLQLLIVVTPVAASDIKGKGLNP